MNGNRALRVPHRTKSQKDADEFDMLTDRLARRARASAEGVTAATMKERKVWATIAATLGSVRADVRTIMHNYDRERTEGP